MAITVTHSKVSTIPDGDDSSLIRPSDWNDDHVLTGLGTMAEQNANNVNITGGSINGTLIGDVTPADGVFADVYVTEALTVDQITPDTTDGLIITNDTGVSTIASFGVGLTTNATISPPNGNVTISPTGTGTVTINPATAGSMNNVAIGATTPSTGKFTTATIASGSTTTTIANNAGGPAYMATSTTNPDDAAILFIVNSSTDFTIDGDVWTKAGTVGQTSGFIRIPSAAGNAGTPSASVPHTAPMFFNESTNTLNVYNPSTNTWMPYVTGALTYAGTWNASTNSPTLTSSVGTTGNFYIVSVAGTTNLNGITDWQAGDWAVFNGSVWQKVDNTDAVVSVNGQTGAVTITLSSLGAGTIATQNANNVAITGGSINGTTIGATTPSTGAFTNAVVSGSTTAGNALVRIEQTGDGYALLVEDSANPDATPFVVHPSGGVSVGNTLDAGSGNLYVAGNMAANIVTALTSVSSATFKAVNSAGLSLQNASGNTQMSMGAGGGDNLSISVATAINPANALVNISPTGTGSLTVYPNTAGALDNMVIGANKAESATFTNLAVSGTLSFDSDEGTNGQVLVSEGPGNTPKWTTLTSGTVTSVSGTAPVSVATGTTTPVISMSKADDKTDGFLQSTDWNTFNNKQATLVSGTNIKTVNSNSLLGSGDLSVGTVTKVDGAGIVSGITLTGSVTSTGNLTLGGALDLSKPPAIGGDTPNTITGTTITATTFNGSGSGITGVAKLSSAQTFTGGQAGSITALTDGATITPDFSANNGFSVTLGGNRTLANPTNLVAGQSGVILVTQDGTGSRTLAYGSYWKFPGGTAPTLTTTANAVDALAYYVGSTTQIDTVFIGNLK